MLVFKNLEEMEPYLDKKTDTYRFEDVVQFCFDLRSDSNISAGDINAWNINAWNINAGNIDAWNINAENIKAGDIKAGDINAGDINANNINYYAVCIAYQTFSCMSVRGRRKNAIHACLDGEIEYKEMSVREEKGEAADV